MSTTLERLLKTEITKIVNNFESSTSRGADPQGEQDKFINDLSAGIARAVQQYLASNVTVFPGQVTVGNQFTQTTTTPGILNAP
jgi:hypothetical protein